MKEVAELKGKGGYVQLNTEGYGGMLCATWMDRPLSIAGRVLVKEGNTFVSKLLSFDKDLVLIPNVAIHMNRDVNNGMKYNNQVDLLPLFSCGKCICLFRQRRSRLRDKTRCMFNLLIRCVTAYK